jgi:hypothetical protein
VQKGIDAAGLAPPRPRRVHELLGKACNLVLLALAAPRALDQRHEEHAFVRKQRLA